jgi:hypothetical protein
MAATAASYAAFAAGSAHQSAHPGRHAICMGSYSATEGNFALNDMQSACAASSISRHWQQPTYAICARTRQVEHPELTRCEAERVARCHDAYLRRQAVACLFRAMLRS